MAAKEYRLQPVPGARELGDEPFELDGNELPYGANFVVRAREQRRFPYDTALGRGLYGGAPGEGGRHPRDPRGGRDGLAGARPRGSIRR